MVGGYKEYGLYINGQTGYRDNSTSGVAVNGAAEGMYMVASGTHVNSGCCFDFGNAETNTRDNGDGHMDAVNLDHLLRVLAVHGKRPLGRGRHGERPVRGRERQQPERHKQQQRLRHRGAEEQRADVLRAQRRQRAIRRTVDLLGRVAARAATRRCTRRARSCSAPAATTATPSIGSFFEGVMTSGYPTDAADNAVQANIVAAAYSGNSDGPPATAGTIGAPGGQCVDVIGDDSGTDGSVVDLWNCQSYAIDQHWTHNSDDSLSTLGRCLDIDGDGTAVGTQVELWDCNGVGGREVGPAGRRFAEESRSPAAAWTHPAATPRTAPGCRSTTATGRRRRSSR